MTTSWPRISIITPSFNQAQYLEQTIESILSQKYPNLEYIVIDGGSTDGSAEIIRRYGPHLTYWVSELDKGQTDAINKGLRRATGEILAYLNSDDYYVPGAFKAVADHFRSRPESDLIHGRCRFVDQVGTKIGEQVARIETYCEILDLWGVWWQQRQFVQPEVFWTRRIAEKIGPLRDDLHYVMDYNYWMRILKAGGMVGRLDREVACFRRTPAQKSTHSSRVAEELLKVVQTELWDRTTQIPWSERKRLQGEWLYQRDFCMTADQSVASQESALRRWGRLGALAVQHPQLFQVRDFRRRLFGRLLPF
jgi:glycosyltransferase involved in cell wall biosynthesis